MKKILLAALILGTGFRVLAASPIDVNEKVVKAFNRAFPNVQEVSWSETPDFYQVRFKQNQVLSKLTYDHQGNIVKTLRYYDGEQLPILILTKVKSRYPDKNIFGVTEESSDEGTFYYIILEDEKNWIHVKVGSDGSIAVTDKYNKA